MVRLIADLPEWPGGLLTLEKARELPAVPDDRSSAQDSSGPATIPGECDYPAPLIEDAVVPNGPRPRHIRSAACAGLEQDLALRLPRVKRPNWSLHPPMPSQRRPRTEIKLPRGSQAEMYLSRAVEQFHRVSNPPDLWTEPDPFLAGSIAFSGAQAIMTEQNNRLQALRTSVLFAAITVEAFANEFAADARRP